MSSALITGIRRIGFEICKRLLESGYDLAIVYHTSEDSALKIVEMGKASGKKVVPIKEDLTDSTSYERIVKTATESLRSVRAFIHVASPYYSTPLDDLERKDIYNHFLPNAEAFIMISKFLYKHMLSLDGDVKGRIITFGDWATNLTPYKNYSAYFISKGALHTAVKVLAKEFAPHVLVNAIALGPTLKPTEFSQERWQEYINKTPLKRPVSIKDVVDLTEFLLKVESMTGEIINLDSGRHVAGECS